MSSTRTLLRHPVLVVVAWLLLTVGGVLGAPKLIEALSYSLALPGQQAYDTNVAIGENHRGGGSNPPLVVVVSGEANDAKTFAAVSGQLREPLEGLGARVATEQTAAPDARMYDAQAQTGYLLVYPPATPGPEPFAQSLPQVSALVTQVAERNAGVTLQVVNNNQLSETSIEGTDRPVIVEILLGGLGALLVLLFVFRSVLAVLPMLMAVAAISVTFLTTYGLTRLTDVSFIVQYLIGLIGLGVAIDYALLIVMRWREERHNGLENRAAVERSVSTAGHAVLFSGLTVAVSLTSLLFVPVPFLRSVGIAGLLIPLFSVVVALTLLPVLLDRVGPRLDRLGFRTDSDTRSRAWERIGRAVVRHRVVAALLATLALVLLALPALGMRLGTAEASAQGRIPAVAGAWTTVSEADLGRGVLRPTSLVVEGEDQVAAVTAAAAAVPGVSTVVTADGPGWVSQGRHVLEVVTHDDPASDAGSATVDRLIALADSRPDTTVGGSAAEDKAFVSAIYGGIIPTVSVIALVTLLLLGLALRSVWLPVKALLLNVLSVAAAYGVTVWVWQEGSIAELLFGLPATGTLPTWVPVAVFAFLFGLSMDYEVFILSRIREEYLVSGDTTQATVAGLGYTGRLVTSGALILFFAFVALATVPVVDVKILATALAAGIIIDATIVRGVLAPALVALLDKANWWNPFVRSRH